MIYKNSLRTIYKKPIQFLALTVMIALSSFTYVTLQNSVFSLQHFLTQYTENTNQEDFFLVFNPPTSTDILEIINNQESAQTLDVVDYYETKSNELEQKYDVTMEGRFYKDVTKELDVTHLYRFIKQTDDVNQTYLIAGEFPKNDDEIALFKQYADANELALNDFIEIADLQLKITGFIAVPDYVYPIFAYDSPLFEPQYETIVLATESFYDSLDAKTWVLYSGYFNDGTFLASDLEQINNEPFTAYTIGRDLNVRINTIHTDILGNELLASTFSMLILGLALMCTLIILRKRVDNERVQIGILKALGYRSRQISLNYTIYPFVASVIGTLIGYNLGVLCSIYLSNRYVSSYIIPPVEAFLNVEVIFQGVVYPILVITVSSFVILSKLVSKKPLKLMQKSSHLKLSFISRTVAMVLSSFSFETRFRYSLAFRNCGKIVGLFASVLVASIFLVCASMTFNAVNTVATTAFSHANYEYQIKYKSITNEALLFSESPFLEVSADIEKVTKQSGDTMLYEEQMPFLIHGVRQDDFINPLVNHNQEVLSIPDSNSIIINEFISAAYEIEIGDEIRLDVLGRSKSYEVIEIANHYNGPFIYVNLYGLNELLNYELGTYNGKWSNVHPTSMDDISYMLSIEDLTRNLETAIEMVSLTLGIIIMIAAILGVVIMILIANVLIDENYEQIAIMKVMGYLEEEVSNLVLTIYFPFIMFAYVISIPITQIGMASVMSFIARELPFSIPTHLTFIQTFIGFTIIFATYLIALFFSKGSLHKISLQEALKY